MKKLLLLCALFVVSAPFINAQTETTLTGQVVCSKCWFEDDRKVTPYGDEEDIACAKRCAKDKIPPALAVTDDKGEAKLYVLESGAFKPAKNDWSQMAGQRVEVTGTVRAKAAKQFVKVNALKALPAQETVTTAAPSGPADLALTDLGGAQQSLKDLRGRLVVLNFWATWCGPCKKEMPDFVALQNDYAAFGVQVIGASADEAADRAKVVQFVKAAKLNFPIWLGATTEQMMKMGLGQELPATVIIGRDGQIVYRTRGVIKPEELRKKLDGLLEESQKVAKRAAQDKPKPSSSVPA